MKQVIVVNGSLNLPPGKLAAQVAHGAVLGSDYARVDHRREWRADGQTKIVLAALNAEELQRLHKEAVDAGILATALVQDAGRTVLKPGTITCLVIGPAPDQEIDKITGSLPLL